MSQEGLTYHLLGYKDERGQVVIPPRFSACGERFYEDLAWASDPEQRKSGYINPDGSWTIVVPGSTHSDFVGGMGEFQVIGPDGFPLFGFVNRKGEVIVPPRYRSAAWYVDGYVLVGERTWVGRVLDKISLEFGVSISTCMDIRKVLLDHAGRKVSELDWHRRSP
ncbi:MAG: WG repeat-containing protein [Phycisphaerales bacterium]|nr:WG repeat-containing protein [Phycisphaerales bacterium]